MKIFRNYSLTKLNTFGISVRAKLFVEIISEKELPELFKTAQFKNNQKIFLGGGSNVLFAKDFNGMVVLNKLKGIEEITRVTLVKPEKDEVFVRAFGGELWSDLVNFSVNRGYWGIENLALIPGTVGAAPMQNIGAYGAELKDTLFNVEAFDLGTGKKKIFTKEECALGYRDSVFKNKLKGKYFISAVILRLSKTPKPNVTYKILADYLAANKIAAKTSKDIASAVANIRRSKLPDPKILGNAGSFFKNVLVPLPKLGELLQAYPNLPYFEEQDATSPPAPLPAPERGEIQYKIPAGWLIEQCDWKGKRIGNVGVHNKQALVIVNYGGATGKEILDLANKIIASVKNKFGLELAPEVNIV
ncbi:MAG: UDP-N-acetylmuramate dehydrogenase [Minisyncoccia bacterium]